ncbi:SsrA-binding protein SmpB [Cytophagales bacterium LB-30]|uniref:SsrA-binding protein n=1 Tax=Shiella aurantiaca TaxID=3058365 RepID=A0ABT8F1U5_9BACT|nr:SsrA-binding protein SmpB [Shiella aurantiaca]MDN4164363.1 SsrA-binding protein SmpB [Shiella aurantiaca]
MTKPKDKKRFSNDINIRNKRANFEYELLESFYAGMVLRGTEIKSIKEGKVNLQDAFCLFHREELYVRGLKISAYEMGTHFNHDPDRERKLLLKKVELRKLEKKMEEKGLTLIPVRLFINERGFAKLEIALAKGKKLHDKRDSIKERDVKRELDRMKY